MTYTAPVRDLMRALQPVWPSVQACPDYAEITPDLVESILEEAGKLASGVLAPINYSGNVEGAVLRDGTVTMPKSFREAYAAYRDGGWNSVPFAPDYGGQGLPWVVAAAVQELWQAANMAFGLCPLLNQGAVEALMAHGTDDLKDRYLANMISGAWTGTMNLTEPQAGSDLSAIRSRAEPKGEAYKITGQKIYITYGDHDLADNIIHMVLARLPDAPEGVRGISLFLVPKVLPDGSRNAVTCVSLEHKLGIHASPTAVMEYDGATGWLVGEAHHGLAHMFTMMNNARLSVGLQGVAIADRALQQAEAYAHDRVQGFDLADKSRRVAIAEHPDVRRMLLTMRALTEAGRALTLQTFAALDVSKGHPDETTRAAAQARVDLLTPVVKGWCTEQGCTVAALGIQVHGGMGYVEETGAAQHLRDARITPIYEGTNGIQAADLVFRKVLRDKGAAAQAFFTDVRAVADQAAPAVGDPLRMALQELEQVTDWLLSGLSPQQAGAASFPYLMLFGDVAAGAALARVAIQSGDDHKAHTTRVYAATTLLAQSGAAERIKAVAGTLI